MNLGTLVWNIELEIRVLCWTWMRSEDFPQILGNRLSTLREADLQKGGETPIPGRGSALLETHHQNLSSTSSPLPPYSPPPPFPPSLPPSPFQERKKKDSS